MEDLTTLNGFQICPEIKKHFPRVQVLAHSVYDDADRVAAIFNVGASGFVSKKSGFSELIDAIKTVHKGEKYICRETSSRLKNVSRFLSGIETTLRERDSLLSKREREVLTLLAHGKSSRQIASVLFVTERTIETHRQNMLEKMSAKNTVELVASALMLGLIKK